jgi:hypothetical protein
MKQCSIILKAAETNGSITLLPHKSDDLQAHKEFVLSLRCDSGQSGGQSGGQSEGLKANSPVYVRAVYTVVTEQYLKFYRKREHYFAYFGRCVSDGAQTWTDGIAGKDKSAKVETLHTQMKYMYGTQHSEAFGSLADKKNETQEAQQKAMKYCEWAIRTVYEAQLEWTKNEPSGAWAVEPYKNMEAI